MAEDRILKAVAEIAEPLVSSLGLVIWGMVMGSAGKRKVIEIYLDKEGGITLEEVTKASRKIGLALEVDDVVPGAFVLEVSSPGLERRFFKAAQMLPYVGQKVKIELELPLDGRKKFSGPLKKVEGDEFVLEFEGNDASFDFSQVKKARLVYEFEVKTKPGKKN